MKIIKVLVVEDSALMRRVIGDIIREHPEMELSATARDGLDALEKIKHKHFDVITMDLEMPRLDGIETVRRIMSSKPTPVVMLSSHTKKGNESTLRALDAGAVDFIAKPALGSLESSLEELKTSLTQKLIAAASARVGLITPEAVTSAPVRPKQPVLRVAESTSRVILAMGASTGGPKMLEAVFRKLPADLPAAILLSQHMPPGFTSSFAQRLDAVSGLRVREAQDGDIIQAGLALVAPGGYHLVYENGSARLDSGPKVNYVKPAVDMMFHSLTKCSERVLVVIMTGMGKDGAAGAEALKEAKADTVFIAQDPATALIPSMPEALLNRVKETIAVPADRLADDIVTRVLVMA